MAISRSRGYCEALSSRTTLAWTSALDITLNWGDGTASDTLTRVSGSWIADGFKIGMLVNTVGFATAGNNVTGKAITNISATVLTFAAATFAADAASGTNYTVAGADSGSFKSLFTGGELAYFGSSTGVNGLRPLNATGQPDADKAVPWTDSNNVSQPSTLLIKFQGFTFGAVQWDTVSERAYVNLSTAATATAIANGTATWFRLSTYTHQEERLLESTTAIRYDGTIGTSPSFDLQITNTTITVDAPQAVSNIKLYFPKRSS